MTPRAGIILSLLAICLIWVVSVPVEAEQLEVIDWRQTSPSDIHQHLWENKAADLADQQFYRRTAPKSAASTQTNYDVTFYDIFLRLDDTLEVLHGHVGIHAEAAVPGVSAVEVDLFDNMIIDSISSPSGQLSYSRASNVVTVDLGASYQTGESFSFTIWYYGEPVSEGFLAFAWETAYSRTLISTLSEPYFARTWWPCKDRNDDKADSFAIAVEVDTSFYVGSNGTLDSTVSNGGNTHTFYWNVSYPMVTYLFSLAVYPYTVWEDEWVYNGGADTMPVVHAVYPELVSYTQGAFSTTPQAITVLSELFGMYPFPDEKYGHSLFSWGGAMEHQTMSSMGANSFALSEPVVIHELAHQWWGDMITCESWHDIWLNEGWASYAEALYYEQTEGFAAYKDYMVGLDYTGGGTIWCQDTTSSGAIFTGRVYDKGAWAIHMLRGVLGDSLFFAGVDAYYNSVYKHRWASTDDFQNVFETATGVDLDYFFDEWIYGTYRPNYYWYYRSEPAQGGGYILNLRVDQAQTTDPQVFTMPVEFYLSGPDTTVRPFIDHDSYRATFHVSANVSNIVLDPDNWVMNDQWKRGWTMFMTTHRDSLDEGDQYLAYNDTIVVKGGSGIQTWSIVGGSLPAGLNLGNFGVIGGTPTDTGLFEFTARVEDANYGYEDEAGFRLYVAPNPGVPGDVNLSGDVNVSDLTVLVDYLFRGGAAPVILNTADVNASCDISVSDLTYLVDYLFRTGPAPQQGCVN